jgi:hypothetical protein
MQMEELKIRKQDADTKAAKVRGDLQLKAEELSLKAQDSARKTGEDPALAAMRLQMEISQMQEAHAIEMAGKQQQLQMQQMQAQQQMAQGGEVHQQNLAHGGQVHSQKMSHAEQAARLRALQTNPTANSSGSKGE